MTEPFLTICRPETEWLLYLDRTCPVCLYEVGIIGMFQEWYGTRFTCLACGDEWQDGELLERPFRRGWRGQNVAHALRHIDEARVIERTAT